jgi:hypothetical protein
MKHSRTAALLAALTTLAVPASPEESRWPVVYERKDGKGRVLSRIVFQHDGTIQRQTFAYGKGSTRLTLDEDLDASRLSVRRVQEKFDDRGRIAEREVTSDKDGRRKGKRTTYRYDAADNQTSETEDIE